jgi:hypothetical protein
VVSFAVNIALVELIKHGVSLVNWISPGFEILSVFMFMNRLLRGTSLPS